MRAIMQGLTDAEFEQLYGTEEQCLAARVKVRQEAVRWRPKTGSPALGVLSNKEKAASESRPGKTAHTYSMHGG